MPKFHLRDRVRINDQQEIRTVEEIREILDGETMYWVQLGDNFRNRIWAKEHELEWAD
jgi:hypothetical protein